jgi:hypothetical protein
MQRVLRRGLIAALVAASATIGVAPAAVAPAGAAAAVPRFSHVIEVFLENESAGSTWEDAAGAPALQQLRKQGVYIPNFYGAGHASLDNYEAAFGAVEPTTQGKADCAGQPYGSCIFPASVPTMADLFDGAGLSWKIYAEGMDGAPGGHACLHALDRNLPDFYQGPGANGYATRHNPAPWFDSILTKGGSEAYCQAHDIDMTHLTTDLAGAATLPAFSFVEPDTCHDGHDTSSLGGCTADPEGPTYPAGVGAINAWLPGFVQQVTHSPAWDDHSLLFLTFDEGAATDTTGCAPCHDTSAGGRIGALAISPMLTPNTTASWQGDHYSFLRTLEAAWGLPTLKSRAADAGAAAKVHDGDPGVTVLSDIWAQAAPAPAPPASAPAAPSGAVRAARRSLPATGGHDPSPRTGAALVLVALLLRAAYTRARRSSTSA